MDKIKLRYQISLFGNFETILPTPDTVKKLMEIMQKFTDFKLLLNIMNEITIDTRTETPSKIDRVSFVDQQTGLRIIFGANRLDFLQELREEDGKNIKEIEEFIKIINSIISELSNNFEEIKMFNRLSLITDFFIKDISEEMKDNIYKKLLNNSFLSDNPIKEWNVRIADGQMDDVLQEKINDIISIDRLQGEIVINNKGHEFDDIKVLIDINTNSRDINLRFDLEKLNNFLSYGLKKYNEINNKIEHNLLKV